MALVTAQFRRNALEPPSPILLLLSNERMSVLFVVNILHNGTQNGAKVPRFTLLPVFSLLLI